MAELIDRVPGDPGRVKITPEGDEAYHAYMELADSPLVEGTKVSKQNVLDTVYPLSDNSAVGTVVQTVAVPDDRWLACDGSEVYQDDTPELYGVLADRPIRPQSVAQYPTPGLSRLQKVKFLNGCYVACGMNASSKKAAIAYTDSPAKACTLVTLSGTGDSTHNCWVTDIEYGGGYYVAVVYDYYGGSRHCRIYYATALDGTWTVASTGSSLLPADIHAQVIYHGGKFFVFCSAGAADKPYMYSATVPTSWTTARMSVTGVICGIVYSKSRGRWETAVYSTASGSAGIQLYTSTTLTSWTARGSRHALTSSNSNALSPIGSYLGVGEQYLNVLLGAYGATYYRCAFSSTGAMTAYPAASGEVYYGGICDGTSELIAGSDADYYRQTADGDFTAVTEDAERLPLAHDWGGTVWEPQGGGVFLPPYADGGLLVMPSLYRRYRPLIAPPDSTGQVKAYIKAK